MSSAVKRGVVLLGLSAFACFQGGTTLVLKVTARDSKAGVPCVLRLHDPGYKDARVLFSSQVALGVASRVVIADPRHGLGPASAVQYVTVACEGYRPASRLLQRQLWRSAEVDLGDVQVQRQADISILPKLLDSHVSPAQVCSIAGEPDGVSVALDRDCAEVWHYEQAGDVCFGSGLFVVSVTARSGAAPLSRQPTTPACETAQVDGGARAR